MIDLRIQIVNYKTKQYLIDCIASMREELEQADFSYSFAILDNASGDDLSDIPVNFPWLKNLEIAQSDNNLGFGAGHNFLAKRGDAEYLLILNPDLKFIEPDTIGRLLRTIKETGSEVVGPRLITTEGVTQAWDHGGWRGILYYWKSVIGIRETVVETKNRQVPWVSGAVLLIEGASFENVNGFDEGFFLYAEELDLCDRVRDNGGLINYVPSIVVMHYGGVAANRNDWILGSTTRLYRNRVLRFLRISR